MITPDDVTAWSGLTLPVGDGPMTMVTAAINHYVDSLPSIDCDASGAWAATTKLGAIMLAARVYRRKNSPGGIEAVGDSMSYIARYDSDISRLLNIDTFRKPVVG